VTALVVLPTAVVVAAAIAYGILRARPSARNRVMTWGRAPHAALPQCLTADAAPQMGGRHRLEDAHTGSLSATAILQALKTNAGER
jgi:hypothetical protein